MLSRSEWRGEASTFKAKASTFEAEAKAEAETEAIGAKAFNDTAIAEIKISNTSEFDSLARLW